MIDAKTVEGRSYPLHGYAPGNYMNFCFNCRQQFIGAKGALRCEPCAEYMDDEIKKLDLATASLAREGEDGEKPYRDAWQRIFADDSLALIRKRMSADNIMRIIRHVHAAMWRPIETLEGGENDFVLARTADGRVMQWRASLLARNLKGPTPDHLGFPAIEWMPSPIKTPKPLSKG